MGALQGKHVVLGITGGIAAYKSAVLLRLLIKSGAEVQVVMTPSAKEFITPVTLSALSGKPVVSEFFTANTGEWHSHVDLGLWADLMIVAPATASTIGKMANGIADNMLVTTYLSAKEQVMIAPAMDLDMWAHPSTQRNVETLVRDGVLVVEPQSGFLASGLTGKGRMAEPEQICEAAERYFEQRQTMAGKKVMITAGPTYENIDPVRYIGNYSSGKMGFALAQECASRGAEVTVIAGPVSGSLRLPEGVKRIDVRSASEMLEASEAVFPGIDYAILAAAVADYAPEQCAEHKLKREHAEEMTIRLRRNPDIAATLGAKKGDRVLVGFALETDDCEKNGRKKMLKKNFDMIVVNDATKPGAGFMTDTNIIDVYTADGRSESFPKKSKRELAADIVDAMLTLGK